jgi:hypothetical protein
MLPELISAFVLVAVTVAVHAAGLALVIRRLREWGDLPADDLWPVIGRLVYLAWALMLIHFGEIAVWALFFWRQGCLPDAESAFYFSGVTYATVGYGDVVLTREWRMLGPVEGLTGSLMMGLSTAFFFAVLSRLFGSRVKAG